MESKFSFGPLSPTISYLGTMHKHATMHKLQCTNMLEGTERILKGVTVICLIRKLRIAITRVFNINPRPAGGGGGQRPPPAGFFRKWLLKYWEFRFETCHTSQGNNSTPCVKNRTQVIIGQPWVTSEWRHISPILTNKKGLRESPPLVEFWGYDQLTNMKWRIISRATKLLSRIFKLLKIWTKCAIFFSFRNSFP